MAETAMTIVEPKAVTFEQYANAAITDIPGFEEFDKADLVMPRYRLVQGTSKDIPDKNKRLGHWWNQVEAISTPTLKAVVLRFKHSRVFFEPGNFTGDSVQCQSNDGRVPVARFSGVFAQTCENCPNANWGDNGEKPLCSMGYTFLCVDVASGMPFMMTWSGTAVKLARQFITAMIGKKRPSYSLVCTFESKYIEEERGSWYVPTFAIEPMTDPTMVAPFEQMYHDYAPLDLEADDTAMVTRDANGDEDGAAPF